ncbi:MAG: hypothetical protein LBL59_07335 [Xanthomonadaceae bacterium]|nr:hypothetical protein [Xanthomonadaceae bacterium]
MSATPILPIGSGLDAILIQPTHPDTNESRLARYLAALKPQLQSARAAIDLNRRYQAGMDLQRALRAKPSGHTAIVVHLPCRSRRAPSND